MRHLIIFGLSLAFLCVEATRTHAADPSTDPSDASGIILSQPPADTGQPPQKDETGGKKSKPTEPAKPAKTKDDKDAKDAAAADGAADPAKPSGGASQIEVTADKSLEWYQDQHIYVARGNAKAVRDDTVVQADLLTAHQRETPSTAGATGSGGKNAKPAKAPKPETAQTSPSASHGAPTTAPAGAAGAANGPGSGDLDRILADGNVRITDERERVLGQHADYDLDRHVAILTGDNLKYETEKETVTAKKTLEYWEDRHQAIARGDAVAIGSNRYVAADMLSAEFRETPQNTQELWKMTAEGHVNVITSSDVARGDRAVYDVSRDIAILTGNVKITRNDGTQLTGDVGEVDFKANQSRLLNDGHGRVRALLTSKTTDKSKASSDNGSREKAPDKTPAEGASKTDETDQTAAA